jgi:hypothetical protein
MTLITILLTKALNIVICKKNTFSDGMETGNLNNSNRVKSTLLLAIVCGNALLVKATQSTWRRLYE